MPERRDMKNPQEGKQKTEKSAFINKYGFLHVSKELAKHLGLEFGRDQEKTPVDIQCIEQGFIVRLKV